MMQSTRSLLLAVVIALISVTVAQDLFQAPPATDIEKFRLLAKGNMTHVCTSGAWVTQNLNADLYSQKDVAFGKPIGSAFSAPAPGAGRVGYLNFVDNSTVNTRTVTFRPSPNADSIVEMLGIATSATPGVAEKVTYIARLNTNGGSAPATACTDAQVVSVPFTLEYACYVLA